MTEAEWNVCDHAALMLNFLRERASPRKSWLVLCGFTRALGSRATDALSRTVVDQLERYADGQLDSMHLEIARLGVNDVREANPWRRTWEMARDQTRKRRCRRLLVALVRDLFGSQLYRRLSVTPAWLTWNNGAIRKMAQAIYDARAFDRLPLLADALEDAGCTDAAILGHCRGGGEHVRGCWLLDLLLGKE